MKNEEKEGAGGRGESRQRGRGREGGAGREGFTGKSIEYGKRKKNGDPASVHIMKEVLARPGCKGLECKHPGG